jgi:hypothetical protein
MPAWDLLPDGHLVSSDGAAARLNITGPEGDTVRRVTVRRGAGRRIPDQERQDSLAALNARLESVPVPLDQVLGIPASVRERELPETLPEVLALHVDTEGRIWVRRWPYEPRAMPTHFDVFDSDGEFVGAVSLPVDFRFDVAPWIGTDHMVVVEADDAYGSDRVALFTFTL